MSPTELIQRMTAEGVTLQVTSSGTLKAIGEQTAVDRWLPILKARKPDLVAALTQLTDEFREQGLLPKADA